uniref:Uncharacterized protein AlNc14C107G6264 n=1 Tax=Albugo laibachii Nc14 TaxID=890382 RepID=F0WI57_9STRA|nr:conserved hypothetical protein [Albugo laibachii Nc14]|eukprot:CCA20935.1 conserved hypothetical protein [Albugo laibachii Nc14]
MECMELCQRISTAFLSDKVEWNDTIYESLEHYLLKLQCAVSSVQHNRQIEDMLPTNNYSATLMQHSKTQDTEKQHPAIIEMILLLLQKLLFCMKSQIEANKRSIDRQIGSTGSSTARRNAVQEITFDSLNATLHSLNNYLENESKRSIKRFSETYFSTLQKKSLVIIQSCALFLPEIASKSQEDTIETLKRQPEEIRVLVLKSLHGALRLLHRAATCVETPELLTSSSASMLLYLVPILLEVAQSDPCADAKFDALCALKELIAAFQHLSIPPVQSPSSTLYRELTQLHLIFPGIATGLWMAVDAPKRPSRVVSLAIECFADVARAVLSDSSLMKHSKKQLYHAFDEVKGILATISLKMTKRGQSGDEIALPSEAEKWMQETIPNADVILTRIFAAAANETSWKVRIAVANLCGILLTHCRIALGIKFIKILEELLLLQADQTKVVARKAQDILQNVFQCVEWERYAIEILPEIGHRISIHIETIALQSGTELERQPVRKMETLLGYIKALGTQLQPILDDRMPMILSYFAQAFQLETIEIDVLTHRTLYRCDGKDSSADALIVSQYRKRLGHFHDEGSVQIIKSLLRSIARIGTPVCFIDCAMDALQSENGFNAEVLFILNEFLSAYTTSNKNDQKIDLALVRRITDDFLSSDAWQHRYSDTTCSQSHPAAIEASLMVECVGTCVEVLRGDFRDLLLQLLYPIVEKLGSIDVRIEQEALTTLQKITYFCEYRSLEHLFEANMDYFVDALCMRLRLLELYPNTSSVIKSIVQYTNITSKALVDEMANSLLQSIDLHQDTRHVSMLLQALSRLLTNLEHHKSCQVKNEKTQTSESSDTKSSLDEFLDQFSSVQYDEESENDLKSINIVGASTDYDIRDCMPIEHDEIQGKNDDAGANVECEDLVVQIMERCGYFVSLPDPISCCLVLRILETGIKYLADSKEKLHPLIHRLWPSLLDRLEVTNQPILAASIRVLCVIIKLSKDFVGHRFVDKVWPEFKRILCINQPNLKASGITRSMLVLSIGNSSVSEIPNDSLQPSRAESSRKSQDFRVLMAVLECLTQICSDAVSTTSIVSEIAQICSPFLSTRHHIDIQQQTCKLFEQLILRNSDVVFVHLCILIKWKPPTPSWSANCSFPQYDITTLMQYYEKRTSALNQSDIESYGPNATKLLQTLL